MGTIGDAAAKVRAARAAFWDEAAAVVQSDSAVLLEIQKDQLYAGQTPTGGLLAPTYSRDPYFKKPGAGTRYAKWKAKIHPRRPASYLKARPEDVPNLIVNGNRFYNHLSCTVTKRQIRYLNAGIDMRPKYGDILGLNAASIAHYRAEYFNGKFNARLRKWL